MDTEQKRPVGRPPGTAVLTGEMRIAISPADLDAIDARLDTLGLATRSAWVRDAIRRKLREQQP